MSQFELQLPKLGESILNATVVRWLKKEGDSVSLDEPICEVATDKVNSEIPSPVTGVLVKIVAKEDDTIDVGALLGIVETEQQEEVVVEETKEQAPSTNTPDVQNTFLSPAVLRLMQKHQISHADIAHVTGTGEGGRVTKKDVMDFIENGQKKCAIEPEGSGQIVKLNSLRQAIAKSVSQSFFTAPHAFLVHTIDMENLMNWVKEHKEPFMKEHGIKLTVTAPLCYVIAKALKESSHLNATYQDHSLFVHDHVHLGVAVAVENGVLVPILRNCSEKTIEEIARDISAMASKVKEGKIEHEDLKGGTCTITNFGMSGVEMGLPIIRENETAIIGLGAIKKEPSVQGDQVVIRRKMQVTLSFDHRAVDGMYGCEFLTRIQKNIEDFVYDPRAV